MKKIFLGLMALTLTVSAMAQKHKNHENKSDKKEWKKEGKDFKGNLNNLNLTSEQKAQMKLIQENFRQQMKEVNKNGTVEQQKARRHELTKDRQQKIMAILTPEQRKQAQELRKDYNGDKRDGNKNGGRFTNITKDLNLSTEQSLKVETINSTYRTNLENLKNNTVLTQEQKKEQMKDLMKQHRSDVGSLLTIEQKNQLKNRRKSQPNS